MSMNEADIVNFLKANIKPLQDNIYGNRYRASVFLSDGTYLPCVVFASQEKRIDLAIRRFTQTINEEFQYRMVVQSFVSSGSSVAIYNVASVEPSPFAWPEEILRQIHGETTMGWTSFTAKMNDGNMFAFGTSFNFEFFELPNGYRFNDIVEIHSGMIIDDKGREVAFDHNWSRECFRDRPFFNCYTDLIA